MLWWGRVRAWGGGGIRLGRLAEQVRAGDVGGDTALHVAAKYGHAECCRCEDGAAASMAVLK